MPQFGTPNLYILRVDMELQEVKWMEFPEAPDDMHWKKADEYGIGGYYEFEKQSFEEFFSEPSRELNEQTRSLIVAILNNDFKLMVNKIKDFSFSDFDRQFRIKMVLKDDQPIQIKANKLVDTALYRYFKG